MVPRFQPLTHCTSDTLLLVLQEFSEVFPHLVTATNVPRLTKVGDVDWDSIDAAFCCLPHATTQEILNSLPKHVKVVDLSADFRLKDVNLYAEWCAAPFRLQ